MADELAEDDDRSEEEADGRERIEDEGPL